MPTPTYVSLGTITLGASALSVTFSSIPATYRDLIVVINGAAEGDDLVAVRFNGDTLSSYHYVDAFTAPTAESFATSTVNIMRLGRIGTNQTSTKFGTSLIQIMDYSATDKHKSVLARTGGRFAPSETDIRFMYMVAGRWAKTEAINSILIKPNDAFNWNAGSTFSLYGVN